MIKKLYEDLGFTEAANNLGDILAARGVEDIMKDLSQFKRTGRMQVQRPYAPLPMVHDA